MKIEVKPVFWIAAAVICLLGYGEDFFVMLLFALIHEGGHIAAAWIFGKKCRKINITPIGVYAEINGYYDIGAVGGIFIAAAGPLVNIIIAVLCRYIGLLYIYELNIALAVFNLLVIYPLDGGRIVKCFCECFMGTVRADRITMRCSYIGSVFLILIGILQTIFFPYNISLICLGKYLMKVIDEEKVMLNYRFLEKRREKGKSGEVFRIRKYAVTKDTEIKNLLNVMGNYYCCVFVHENGAEINEREIIEYAEKNGISGNIGEMGKYKENGI